jgi:hypothetical protein
MARKPFGGYTISFAKVKDMTLGEAFGTGHITPSEMTKKIWKVVKGHNLSKKG